MERRTQLDVNQILTGCFRCRKQLPPAQLLPSLQKDCSKPHSTSGSIPHSILPRDTASIPLRILFPTSIARKQNPPPTPKLPSMSSIVEKRAAAREVIDILCEISTILVTSHFPRPLQPSHNSNVFGAQNTHLDRQTLSICVSLIENGVNPEALAVSDSGWEVDCGC